MAAPQNYNVAAVDPNAFTQGIKNAAVANSNEDMNAARRDAVAAKEAKAAQNAALNADIEALMSKPKQSSADYANLVLKHPSYAEQFKQSWELKEPEIQRNEIKQLSGPYAALSSGKPDLAKQLLETQAVAFENAGNTEDAKAARDTQQLVDNDAPSARGAMAMRLAAIMGPEKFAETMSKLESNNRENAIAPANQTKAQAEASRAATLAKFEESQQVQELAKKGWDIEKIKNDIFVQKENARIAALQASKDKTTDALKEEELQLKIDKAKTDRDTKIRENAATVQNSRITIDSFIGNIDKALKADDSSMNSVLGIGAGLLPTLLPSSREFESVLDTIDAQAFTTMVENAPPGALSEVEGRKLSQSLGALKNAPNAKVFKKNAAEVQRVLGLMRSNMAEKYGVPDTIPETPDADITPDDINAAMAKYKVQ